MESSDEDHGNWGYIWSQMQWKRQFVAVSPGRLVVFPSEQRDHIERKLLLNGGTTVKIIDSTESGKASVRNVSKSHFWQKLTRSSFANQNLPEPEGAIVIVKSSDGKKLFILVPNQHEAEAWKAEIKQASAKTMPQKPKATQRLLFRLLSLNTAAASKNVGASRIKPQRRLRWEIHRSEETQLSAAADDQSSGLDTLQDCTAFLKLNAASSHRALEAAARMIDHFNGSFQMGGCFLSNELRIEAWKGTVHTIVRILHDQLLAMKSDEQSEKLWLACETWVMAAAHDKIMGACEQMFAADDRELSRLQLKLRQVDPSLLGVTADLKNVAFGEAIHVFGTINSYRTPLEKAGCLRKTVRCVVEGIKASTEPCTDDLLSLMLLLMSHAKVQHLQATACYMENFFQIHEEQNHGELRYHITNFAAACAYLSSPEIKELVSDVVISPASSASTPSSSSSFSRSNFRNSSSDAVFGCDSSPEFILAPTYL